MKTRCIWSGIFIIIFCFGSNNAFAQRPTCFYVSIDKKAKSFIFKDEVSVDDYQEMLFSIRKEYGENSEQYKSLLPDTAKYKIQYGIPFVDTNNMFAILDYREKNRKPNGKFPMVAISYEQAETYCKWVEIMINKRDSILNKSHTNSYIWQCSLPAKADYEKVFKKAKITQKKSLSPLRNQDNCSCHESKDKNSITCICRSKFYPNRVFGLTDNVAEYTKDKMILEGGENTELKFVEATNIDDKPIGFRIKATLIQKNRE